MDNHEEQIDQEPIVETTTQQEDAAAVPETTTFETSPSEMPSMEELMDSVDMSLELPRPGETKTGFIVRRNEDEILVSIGAKSEGVIPGRELSQLSEEELEKMTVGAEVTVVVVTLEDSHGNLVLSYTRAQEEADWDRAERLLKTGELYESEIAGYNKGGLIVKLGQLRGFVPASQVSLSRRMAFGGSTPDQRWGKMIGQAIIVKVLEVDRERQRLIFSELAVLQESREIFKERLLSEISVGDEIDGRVTSLADFGAFVNINGADGLVHLTEISWDRIKHPSEVLKVGESVRVRVISIDEQRKRIGLSIRQLLDDPWPQKIAHLLEGQLIQARIVRLVKFGAFARLEGTDIEGLVHISELSDQRVEHPKEVLTEGEELTLRIVRIEPDEHRIGLSLRKVHSAAYAELDLKMALAEPAVKEVVEEPAPETETEEPTAEVETEEPAAEAEAVEEPTAEVETEEPAAEAEAEEPTAEVETEAPVAEAEAEEPAAEVETEAPVAEAEAEEPAAEVETEEPTAEVETEAGETESDESDQSDEPDPEKVAEE
ncbi:MAG TPA: S1 RNA-binding domain-containing protein [Anaerolineales bacterium]|nr:S1 RNA-binding domain-containing protein [Anaerolineales bacterium]